MNDQDLFDPSRLPPRDEYGMTFHPDLEDERWEHPDLGEEYLSAEAILEAGFESRQVMFEYDAPAALRDRYYEDGDTGVAEWEPSRPDGDGWVLVGIWDSEDSPCAMFVRRTPEGVSA
jgi:hypothetical protein